MDHYRTKCPWKGKGLIRCTRLRLILNQKGLELQIDLIKRDTEIELIKRTSTELVTFMNMKDYKLRFILISKNL
jgi:hypothetical protein